MRLTPLQLEVLLHTYYSPSRYPRMSGPAKEAIDLFVDCGIFFEVAEQAEVNYSGLSVTEKGKAWVEAILSVPMPVQKWEIPKESK